ncbi:SUKH superfamily protein [Litoreibacter meonggei]|uniref:SUKH superfamily protein n=1 Tax=Litoreibacter meonggei TaxID=1049199 RepID=A0A497VRQ1_9RHOB|nr:SMI1/KNR4 family protein [Litoreibacter meonggei]RLJ40749.1 SUKH superfamily protein [Litoreibacter meonggei]
MELLKFGEKWSYEDEEPKKVSEADLRTAEINLKISFPNEYVEQVLAVGLPRGPKLLDAICDFEMDLHDLSEFCTPPEIVEETVSWHKIGLPDHLVVIATDCMGSKFCFDTAELKDGPKQSAAIYFWDHEMDETEKLADSFRNWILSYLGSWSD